MGELASSLSVALRLAQSFERSGLPYAIGGALAYAQVGIPRATLDVDVNVFLDAHELPRVLEALVPLGVSLDEDLARREVQEQGMLVAWCEGVRIDVFFPSIDFSWEAGRTRVQHTVRGQLVYFLAPEALAVFKLLFFRGKDLVDLERMIAVAGDRVDASYVRRHLVAMMGPDDERVAAWDKIVSEHSQAP